MKFFLAILASLLSTVSLGQDTLWFDQVVDWDGKSRRVHDNVGYWVFSDSVAVKSEKDYAVSLRVAEQSNGKFVCVNAFEEKVVYVVTSRGEVIVRNLSHSPEQTIYRKK